MYFLALCEDYRILNVIYIIKTVIKIVCIAAPIILIISLMISLMGYVISGEGKSNSLNDITKGAVSKIISAVIIFLVPTILSVILSIIGFSVGTDCYNNATREYIEAKKEEYESKKQLEYEKILQMNNKAYQDMINHNQANSGGSSSGGISGGSDNSNYADGSSITSGNITSIDVSDLPSRLYYSNQVVSSVRINSQIASKMHNILYNVSSYVASNSFIGNFSYAGAYTGKAGYHGKGLAIDLFNNWSYNYNGKTYRPYSGQGTSTWNSYNKFICEVCNGKENCPYNINYVIYEKFFKGNGWCWGGNWGPGYFDPMHYELTNGGCSTSNKQRVSCGG